MRLTLFIYTLFFACCTAALHILALHFSLYWIFLWFDRAVHFLGGCMVAFLFASLLHTYLPRVTLFFSIGILVICVGVLWEVFEYSIGVSSHELRYWGDTFSDLVFDVLGGVFGMYLVHRITR